MPRARKPVKYMTGSALHRLKLSRGGVGSLKTNKKVVGIVVVLAIVAAAVGVFFLFAPGGLLTGFPISTTVTREGDSWVITLDSVPEDMAAADVGMMIFRNTGERFSFVRLADFTPAGTNGYFQQTPSDNIAAGDRILLNAASIPEGYTFQLQQVPGGAVLGQGTFTA